MNSRRSCLPRTLEERARAPDARAGAGSVRMRAAERMPTTPSPAEPSLAPADLAWHWRAWGDLTTAELHALLQLRSRVFVVEQACVYLDVDGRDPDAFHVLGKTEAPLADPPGTGVHGAGAVHSSSAARAACDAHLAAYARVFAPGARYEDAACIGRVITHPSARGRGLGRAVMVETITGCERRWPGAAIGLEAQQHLGRFYGSLGFRVVGVPYVEDGIPHVSMRRP